MNGILLIDKPSGWTSFDVVNFVRRMVASTENLKTKSVKVGHTGTLDPLATGLLVVLIGNYTKRASEMTKLDKTYGVSLLLGSTSITGDREGVITKQSDYRPSLSEVKAALQCFTGEILQKPPIYSAVKVNGQRAYKLARAGEAVEIEPRKVIVNSLQLKEYSYPLVRLKADVSSGTYIRSLVGDIGQNLGTGAYMSDLRRTRVGQFFIKDAKQIKEKDLLSHVFVN
jgi:tRNA pseudouridine55 synthase